MMKGNPMRATKGQTVVEYALLVGLVVLVLILILSMTGNVIRGAFCSVVNSLSPKSALGCSAYFSEDFNDMSDWRTVYGNANWALEDGNLVMTGGDQRMINTTPLPDDYKIILDSAQIKAGPGYGILFRQSQNGSSYSGYSFQVDPGLGNKFAFRRYDRNGAELGTPLAVSAPHGSFDWHAPHKVEVVVKGSTYSAYIDGNLVLTATDTTYKSGQVGLRTWTGTQAVFGHMTVTAP